MAKKRNPQLGSFPDRQHRTQAAALRTQGLSFGAVGLRLGISNQVAFLLTKGPVGHIGILTVGYSPALSRCRRPR